MMHRARPRRRRYFTSTTSYTRPQRCAGTTTFNSTGAAQGHITRIEDGGGGSIVPAFFTVRMTQGLAAAMARDELAHHSAKIDADKRALLRLLAESPEPEEILAFLLNLVIVAGA
jgi:hypothetical protein